MPNSTATANVERDDPYRQIFHGLGIGLVRVNLDGYFLEVNARFAAMMGHAPDALIGMHLADITHPDDIAASLAQIDAARHGQTQPCVLTKRQQAPDGRAIWTRIELTLLRDHEGRPLQFIGVAHEGLTHVANATAPLHAQPHLPNTGFDLMASMSHALRTPLNAILGFAQLLRVDPSQSLSQSQCDKVSLIEQSGANLLCLLSDVVDLSRIESMQLPLHIHLHPLKPIVDDAFKDIADAAHKAKVFLHRPTLDLGLHIWADADRLKQVLMKIMMQCIQHQDHDAEVIMDVHAINQQIAITVSASQTCLSAAQQSAIFESPHFQIDTEHLDQASMGLRIAKRLTELMQGRLEVITADNWGAGFRVWLPQGHTDEAQEDPTFHHTTFFGDLEEVDTEQVLHVLYAEDNVINIELVRQVMRMRPQWQLQVAYCGQEAITMAMTTPPDLLLLDMHLGDMKGLEVAHVLSRHAHTAPIPKVALSADVQPDRIREARLQGFLDYLTKPLDVGRLLKVLDRVAQKRKR